MQNTDTIKELGFQQNSRGMWFWEGENQTFVAKLGHNSKYIKLYLVYDKIDNRKASSNKGHHYLNFIKDCCSDGSVEQVLKIYDIEDSHLQKTALEVRIIN